jgi:GNAT superfamily N-acetyltransferase
MEAITKWALEQGANQIGLGVTEMNIEGLHFYEHLGYTDLGFRAPWPPDPTKQILILGRRI